MTNFIVDGTSLNAEKSDRSPLTGEDPTKYIRAADWNQHRTALVDTQTYLRTESINVIALGADATGATSALPAFDEALTRAKASTGKRVVIPPGRYKLPKRWLVDGARGVEIIGSPFATLVFASDDTTIVPDATDNLAANPDQAARSGIFLVDCQDVSIVGGMTLEGGTKQQISTTNIGAAVYARRARGTRADITVRGGYSPFISENNEDTTGTGDSITVSGGTVTIADAANAFPAGSVGRYIVLNDTTNPKNSGRFPILTRPGAGTITISNPDAANETSSFSWVIEDGDAGLDLTVKSYDSRGPIVPCRKATLRGEVWRPLTMDRTGRPQRFSISGSTVTMYLPRDIKVGKNLIGRRARITDATSGGNNGTFPITNVTPRTATTPATIEFTNASGVSEYAPDACRYHIAVGEKYGLGNGASALSKSGSTMTLTANASVFTSADIGKIIHPYYATTAGNNGGFVIESVPAPNEVTYTNAAGASEAFSGVWTVDSFDNGKIGSDTYGSTHGVYLYAGRSDITIEGMKFYGVRTDPVKVSGSATKIDTVVVRNCLMIECGSAWVGGADDGQEHTGLVFDDNTVVDCGNGRMGWTNQVTVWALGSRGTRIRRNTIRYTHDAVSMVDGRGTNAGSYGIYAGRYLDGISQPLEDIEISGNSLLLDNVNCTPGNVLQTAIYVQDAGILARWATAGTLTKSGNTMTLTHSGAAFGQELAEGWTISLVNSASGNDVSEVKIDRVTGTSSLEFTNAGGTGGGVSAGTYRIRPPDRMATGACRIFGNTIAVGQSGIKTSSCVASEIFDNAFDHVILPMDTADCMPVIRDNRAIGVGTTVAGLLLNSGTAWPIAYNNVSVGIGSHLGSTPVVRGDLGIGVDGTTRVDYPLLGKSGRMKVSEGKAELMFAYGTKLVDGDSFQCNGTTYTYKATAPGAGQFNAFGPKITANTVLNLLDNLAGMDADDYGNYLTPTCTTGHARVRGAAVTGTADLYYIDNIKTLNPTALVVLRNDTAGGEAIQYSRGEGSAAGAVHDQSVIWSPMARFAGLAHLVADNDAARTLLAAGGYRAVQNVKNGGCCVVVKHNDTAGTDTEELRWELGGA